MALKVEPWPKCTYMHASTDIAVLVSAASSGAKEAGGMALVNEHEGAVPA